MLFLLIVNLLLLPPQDQAERLYDNAITFMNAGKYKEALADFDTIIKSFSDTDWAPKALLELGTYYLDVVGDADQSLGYMNQLQANYPSSQQAPAAYYYRAVIASRVGNTRSDLEAATADLVRMGNLFPGNSWSGGSLFLFGSLSLRLDDYKQSLSHFQRLEFSEPGTSYLQQAWLLSAQAAFLDGQPHEATMILARLQARFPNGAESEVAASQLRLLDRIKDGQPVFGLDKTFFGSTPKSFSNPASLLVSGDGTLAVTTSKNYHLVPLANPSQQKSDGKGDLEGFALGPQGLLLMVYSNRVVSSDGKVAFKSLQFEGAALSNIKSAAMDDFERLYVVDSSARDVLVFSRNGSFIKSLNMNKAKAVSCYRGRALVLAADGDNLRGFDADLNPSNSPSYPTQSVNDFCFDYFGNLYVLQGKGTLVNIYSAAGARLAEFNLRSGAYPLKQAQALTVDASGSVYLADRRGGAIYRFH